MDQVFVTNKNAFLHADRYNGQDYVFPPGEKVAIPLDVAEFFFGFNRVDKTEALVRQGWANLIPGQEEDWGVKILRNFVFTKAVMVEEPVADAPTVEVAAQA